MKKGGVMLVLLAIAILIGLVAGFYLSGLSKSCLTLAPAGKSAAKSEMKKGDFKNTFEDGWAAARAKLAESGIIARNTDILSGQITEIKGNEITFSANLVNPLDDESLKIRTAVVGNGTKIIVYKEKKPEVLARDRENLQQQQEALYKEQADLQEDLNKCVITAAPSAETSTLADSRCAELAKKQNELLVRTIEINKKADMYEVIENAFLTDLKVGASITVVGKEVKASSEATSPAAIPAMYREDISSQQKFEAGRIEVRIVEPEPLAAPSPVNANPATPAIGTSSTNSPIPAAPVPATPLP